MHYYLGILLPLSWVYLAAAWRNCQNFLFLCLLVFCCNFYHNTHGHESKAWTGCWIAFSMHAKSWISQYDDFKEIPPLVNPYLHSIPLPLLLVFHDTFNINYVRVGLPGISSVKYNSVKHTVLTVLMRLTLAYAENIKKNRKIKCSSWNSHSELYGVEFMSLAKQFFIWWSDFIWVTLVWHFCEQFLLHYFWGYTAYLFWVSGNVRSSCNSIP